MKLFILCTCGVHLLVLRMWTVLAAKAPSERNTEVSAATNSVLSSPTLPGSGHFEDFTKVSNFDLATESPFCPPGLPRGQKKWRTTTRESDIMLNYTNIACSRGKHCPSETNISQDSEKDAFSEVVELQYGDKINFLTRVEVGNESFAKQINVTKLPEKESGGCNEKQFPVVLSSNETQNITLEKGILSPGTYVLNVKLFLRDVDCILSWELKMEVRMHQCSKNKDSGLCSGTGICAEDKFDSFSCVCCPGYIGKYCEEKDGCYNHPCQHGGFCVDIAEGLSGNTFQCLCPHGYKGRSCENQVNLCDRRPCLNNGICQGNQTSFRCHCAQGFSGPNCGLNLNECLSNPCIHGVCEDGIGTYKCYCLPGYGGDHCEFEYDECDSNPCINGGACEDLVAGYRCHCGPGYRGKRCQIKVELCKPNPCQPPSQCVDRGNNYSCVCHPGFNGPGCTHHYDPCYPNPCQNGGSCWPNLDSFFCSCDQEHSGDLCEVKVRPPQRYVADYAGGTDKGLVTTNPVTVSLDHLHSMYAAAATLVGSCVVVILVVTICHCRIHKTYQHFTRMFNRSGSEVERQKLEDPGKVSLNLRGNASDAHNSMEPSFEACSIDLMDNLDIPLIK